MGWLNRSIRPPDDIVPNENDPASVPPSTVGPDQLVTPGDPDGVTLVGEAGAFTRPPRVLASAWSGWPADWWPPLWGNGHRERLTDTAWVCVDLNASLLSTMPPYLVGAADSLDSEWLRNPDPTIYTSWEEFAKQLFWDYQLGEAFVLATGRYATGFPARFRVVPPWFVNIEMQDGRRVYSIGADDVTRDICHLRYQSTIDDAHGHGPLEIGCARLVAADLLGRYATGLIAAGGIPSSVLEHPEELTAAQADLLREQWVAARVANLGEPAVVSGGAQWKPTQMSPTDMALLELQQYTESRIAVMFGVPPFIVGLPSGGDSLTYSTVAQLFDYHWRAGLRPRAQAVMSGLSEFLLPRGTTVEVNRDAYVQPPPLERAQVYEILNRILDADGNPAITIEEIRQSERFTTAAPVGGVLR